MNSLPVLFVSYARKDDEILDSLLAQLNTLKSSGHAEIWTDRRIEPGAEFEERIMNAIDAASVAILVVTPHSLNSEFIINREVPELLERYKNGKLRFFAILATHVQVDLFDWLKHLQRRPKDGRPLVDRSEIERQETMAEIVGEIKRLLSGSGTTQYPASQPVPPEQVHLSLLPSTGEHLFGRESELQELDGAWNDFDSNNVLSIVAWGGVGKSSLVNKWLASMAKDHYRGAKRVFGWSFHSQGAQSSFPDSIKTGSADEFIHAALKRFGDPNPETGTPWEKGERLVELIRQQRTLLVLDGLEPLQQPPATGAQEGELKDPALRVLLRELAASNPGLCLITTRLSVMDLRMHRFDTAPEIRLEQLTPTAGAQLLRKSNVNGTQRELELASSEFGGHSLALVLLGSYLRDVCDGDVRRYREVSLIEEDLELGGPAGRVMASYEREFSPNDELTPEVATLRMLGLFDRPAKRSELKALQRPPLIKGLNDPLLNLTERKWRQVVARLRRADLVTISNANALNNEEELFDTHALVREYFGAKLRETHPNAWRDGNDRLFEHLRSSTDEFPETLERILPLFAAVTHGCRAGRHREALANVFWMRIRRGREHFSPRKRTAFGEQLAALSCFFDQPWETPAADLTDIEKAWVLGEAGLRLALLGRLSEGVGVMQASLDISVAEEDWEEAATIQHPIYELYVHLGQIEKALEFALSYQETAKKSGSILWQTVNYVSIGDAYHQLGQLENSRRAFETGLELFMQLNLNEIDPKVAWVGFLRFCDFLLSEASQSDSSLPDETFKEQVNDRACQVAAWPEIISDKMKNVDEEQTVVCDIFRNFILGETQLLLLQHNCLVDCSQAMDHFSDAIDALRDLDILAYLPWGLRSRAMVRRIDGDLMGAEVDLNEAMNVATRSGLKNHQADCQLEKCRLHLALAKQDEKSSHIQIARECLDNASKMVKEMRYHRREAEVQSLNYLLSQTK